jgi:hypothetical protein
MAGRIDIINIDGIALRPGFVISRPLSCLRFTIYIYPYLVFGFDLVSDFNSTEILIIRVFFS